MPDQIPLETLIAGYSALLQTIQVWQATRDRRQAKDAFDVAVELSKHRKAIQSQAMALSPLIPQHVLDQIRMRFNNCWINYSLILDPGSGASDQAVDNAELQMINCACREAKRLYDLGAGSIPPGPILDFWNAHQCWNK